MTEKLIITNGGAAVEALSRAGVTGKVLSWDDVLHDGPVPGGNSDAELRAVRAAYLAQMGPGEAPDASGVGPGRLIHAQERLRERDEIVDTWKGPILLWFEHDLYDQLQLIQILDRLGSRPEVWLLQMDDFVTHHSPEALRRAEDEAVRVTDRRYRVATAAWSAFTANNPRAVVELSSHTLAPLPFLGAALDRWLLMFPGRRGLSLTEGWVVDLLREGPGAGARLFSQCQTRELAAFRGDSSFWAVLKGLESLLVSSGDVHPAQALWSLTELGDAVRSGEVDRVEAVGIDRWLGGTHLNSSNDWRWIDGSLILRSGGLQNPPERQENRS